MHLLKYITVETGEDFDAALARIKREVNHLNFVAAKMPHKLSGNSKVLQLVSKQNISNIIKIDGPGFIMDELFQHFLGK